MRNNNTPNVDAPAGTMVDPWECLDDPDGAVRLFTVDQRGGVCAFGLQDADGSLSAIDVMIAAGGESVQCDAASARALYANLGAVLDSVDEFNARQRGPGLS